MGWSWKKPSSWLPSLSRHQRVNVRRRGGPALPRVVCAVCRRELALDREQLRREAAMGKHQPALCPSCAAGSVRYAVAFGPPVGAGKGADPDAPPLPSF